MQGRPRFEGARGASVLVALLGATWLAAAGCASAPGPGTSHEAGDSVPRAEAARDPAAAPPHGAECGDRTCGVDELCVPQGFCSGIRPPTPPERRVTYECVPVPHACAEAPTCGCAGRVCRYGGCHSITAGVVTCICA